MNFGFIPYTKNWFSIQDDRVNISAYQKKDIPILQQIIAQYKNVTISKIIDGEKLDWLPDETETLQIDDPYYSRKLDALPKRLLKLILNYYENRNLMPIYVDFDNFPPNLNFLTINTTELGLGLNTGLRNLPVGLEELTINLEKYKEGDLDFLPANLKKFTFGAKIIDKPIANLPAQLEDFTIDYGNVLTSDIELPASLKCLNLPASNCNLFYDQLVEKYKDTNIAIKYERITF